MKEQRKQKNSTKKAPQATKEKQNVVARKMRQYLLPVVVAVVVIVLLVGGPLLVLRHVPTTVLQDLNYDESTATILNPDQGFYSAACVSVEPDSLTDRTYIIKDQYRLYHLRMDISAFSQVNNGTADLPLTDVALQKIDEMLAVYLAHEKNVVIRFAYDKNYSGNANREPAVPVILQHIQQLAPVLNKYQDTLTAIEAGLVGPYGEMHTSAIAKTDAISQIIATYLTYTQNIPILVRTPRMIYQYLGIGLADLDTHRLNVTDQAYRLGLFNDGYLGSDSDLGTYTDRSKEVAWVAYQTDHLPFGGEVTVPESSWHDIERCVPEMFQLHLSYLNDAWNQQVIKKWQQTYYTKECGHDQAWYGRTAYDYIQNHFGYRLVLRQAKLTYAHSTKKLKINLVIDNVGFGNLNRLKNLTVYFVDQQGNVQKMAAGSYGGERDLQLSLTPQLTAGSYTIFLGINTLVAGQEKYAIQLANDGLYNSNLAANKIGTLLVP